MSCEREDGSLLYAGNNTCYHSFRYCLPYGYPSQMRFAKTKSLSECTVPRTSVSSGHRREQLCYWSFQWTRCDINVEIKKFAQISLWSFKKNIETIHTLGLVKGITGGEQNTAFCMVGQFNMIKTAWGW